MRKIRIFATADTHFNHIKIIKYCNRPFANIEEMNNEIIKRWNAVVSDNDIVIHCGDFAFIPQDDHIINNITNIVAKLVGRKMIIKGNHDNKQVEYTKCGFYKEFFQELILKNCRFVHNPSFGHQWTPEENEPVRFHSFLPNDIFTFYGHVHAKDSQPIGEYFRNVCVDVNNFTPLDITEMLSEEDYNSIVEMMK